MPDTKPSSFFTPQNLAILSREYLVIVMFVKSRSEAFPLALDVASSADLFVERDLETLKIYVAGFVKSFTGAMQSVDLIHYVRGWKGTHFYAQGRMVIGEMEPAFQLESVLKCFADSCAARDHRAHCFRLIDDPFNPLAPYRNLEHIAPYFRHYQVKADDGTYVFPCKHMLQWFRAQHEHPALIQDQIQAEGVEKMCDVCPRFNPDDFGVTAIMRKS
ncbi:hypothetical protein [Paraburkholderia caledonica]|uniref:Uncharacterized protein n=1 Tax=Paraburkholderia caledonica TaxID=134536 RepID=A0AB73INW7_9BURK|nr:hypothetical protein [Paraburkholderia caledonica]